MSHREGRARAAVASVHVAGAGIAAAFAAAVAASGPLRAQGPPRRAMAVPPHDGTQLRLDVGGQVRIARGLEAAVRAGGFAEWTDRLHAVDAFAVGALTWDLGRYLTVAPGYRYQTEQQQSGETSGEHRFTLAVTPAFPLGRTWRVSDRHLIEWRLVDGERTTRYRNRVLVERRLTRSAGRREDAPAAGVTLYAADEVFYDTAVRGWRRNRVYLGVQRSGPGGGREVYYFRQTDRFSAPGFLHVVGVSVDVRLR